MNEFNIVGLYGSFIVIVTMTLMISGIRWLANAVIVITFLFAALIPLSWSSIDTGLEDWYLYLLSFGLGVAAPILTVPLWGISTLMMRSEPSNSVRLAQLEKQIQSLEKKLHDH